MSEWICACGKDAQPYEVGKGVTAGFCDDHRPDRRILEEVSRPTRALSDRTAQVGRFAQGYDEPEILRLIRSMQAVVEAAEELWNASAEKDGNPTSLDVYDVLREPLKACRRESEER